MSTQLRATVVFVMAAAVTLLANAQARTDPHQASMQTHFSAEDAGVVLPVRIPPEVMLILAADPTVKDQIENEDPRPTATPQSWFSASKIGLGPANSAGLIVQATGPLVGGNVTEFWLFIQSHGTWKLALSVSAHDLTVAPKRSNGYKIVEAEAMTCCRITTERFRYNGRAYKRYSSKTEEIK